MKHLTRPAHKGLETVKTYQPGRPIEEIERELGVKNALKLASNENPFGPSPRALVALRKAAVKLHRYPDAGCFYLKKALSQRFDVEPNQIAIGNGSDELIVMAIRAFVAPDEEVLTAVPTFLIYRIATEVHGASVKEVPMKDFHYDLDAMAKAINKRTRIIFIANPDNPVGSFVMRRPLERFLTRVPKNCLVFLDEAYFEYAQSEVNYPDGLKLLKRYPNVIVSRTFSKAYGLCGLRVGYAFAAPAIIDGMNKVREPFNVNSLAQAGAIAALEDKAFLRHVLTTTAKEKKQLTSALRSMGFSVIPSATNFLLVEVGSDAELLYERLLRKGIIVRYMGAWGLSSYLRITIGTPADNRRLIQELMLCQKI